MDWKTLISGAIVYACIAIPAVLHAAFYKRHSRAALGWIAFILTTPMVGGFIYAIFGVNRVRARSRRIRFSAGAALEAIHELSREERQRRATLHELPSSLAASSHSLVRTGAGVSDSPLVGGNGVLALHHGEEAFPEMLAAINGAKNRVWLTTYIFDTDPMGLIFIDALIRAHERGVDVRVIVDGVGQLIGGGLHPASARLRKAGVAVARFIPPRVIPPQIYINLRNHRKVLVIDGEVGFTGGMNIGGRHLMVDPWNKSPVQDLHFRLRGPIVRDLQWLFLQDWALALHYEAARRFVFPNEQKLRALTQEKLELEGQSVSLPTAKEALQQRTLALKEALEVRVRAPDFLGEPLTGLSPSRKATLLSRMSELPCTENEVSDAWCRLVVDGPDLELNRLEMLIAGAIAAAERRVHIYTPYFLPTESITAALATAAMRDVDVKIIVPEKSNEPLVEHAMYRMLPWLLRRGVKVIRQPKPFAHTKLLLVDENYAQIGSTNIDPRSLRLNFEHVVEVYCEKLVAQLDEHFAPILERCEPITEDTIRTRGVHTRAADAFCWLFSPYL